MNGQEILNSTWMFSEIALAFRFIDPREHYPLYNGGRNHHGLSYVIEGCETYLLEDITLQTRPGDVIYLPKSAPYRVETADDCCTVICIDFEMAAPFECQAFRLRPNNTQVFKNSFLEIERCWQLKHTGWVAECMSIAYRILSDMQRLIALSYTSKEILSHLQPGVDYLHSHIDDPDIRIEELAEKCDYHPRCFSRAFREVYGISPKKYLVQLRMSRARELLLSNRYSVTEVGQMTGFSDIYHFSKTFKQMNGVSPTEYYNSHKK